MIRQNEDFPHNEAHAKSDIIQSGPFSSAFVLGFFAFSFGLSFGTSEGSKNLK